MISLHFLGVCAFSEPAKSTNVSLRLVFPKFLDAKIPWAYFSNNFKSQSLMSLCVDMPAWERHGATPATPPKWWKRSKMKKVNTCIYLTNLDWFVGTGIWMKISGAFSQVVHTPATLSNSWCILLTPKALATATTRDTVLIFLYNIVQQN